MGEQDGLGTVAHTSRLDFRGTGCKCQPPCLKRFDCSGWCLSHCQGQQCQSEGRGGSGYTVSEHETPQKAAQTRHWEAECSLLPHSRARMNQQRKLHCWKIPSTKQSEWASLVAQWLRIHLPMQGTWVRALVREDPTCRGATKPVRHNYWACALEPASHNYWACVPQLLKPVHLEPVLHKRGHHSEKPAHRNEE